MPDFFRSLCAAGLAALVLLGCQPDAPEADAPPETPPPVDFTPPPLANHADSVAFRLTEGHGGLGTFAATPYLGFSFAVEREGTAGQPMRHLWNRRTGDYRLESGPGEEPYVTLFNVNTRAGEVFFGGARIDSSQQAEKLEEAYGRFINDSYWLLAPLKVFDEGVTRTYVADSSGGAHDVLRLTFDGVGLTPGDTYWLYVNKETGRLDRWAYVLERDPDAPPRVWDWVDVQRLDTGAGPLFLATRKSRPDAPFAILTGSLRTPTAVPPDLFTDPQPRLARFLADPEAGE
ncbi:MAG: hypothetical protein R3247_05585 [Rhodothermales bacterium]|nr:hypothetical protein [Rhodothermales bacterium]